MKLLHIICCETNILDSRRNTVSLINVIEEFSSSQFPFLVPQFSIVAIFEKGPKDPEAISIEVVLSLGKQELLRAPIDVVFNIGRLQRTMVDLKGLVIPVTGMLEASILRNGREIGNWKMPVGKIEAP